MKWRRYVKGVFFLKGNEHFAVIVRKDRDNWLWGVFDGEPFFSEGYEGLSTAPSKEYAKFYAQKRLKKLD